MEKTKTIDGRLSHSFKLSKTIVLSPAPERVGTDFFSFGELEFSIFEENFLLVLNEFNKFKKLKNPLVVRCPHCKSSDVSSIVDYKNMPTEEKFCFKCSKYFKGGFYYKKKN